MKRNDIILWGLVLLFAVLMSIPFLVPNTGLLALVGFVPLLCMERIAGFFGKKHIWIYHYTAFVLWNAFTTFWVCNATVGGGIFAVFANALQMSLVFGLFRLSKKHLSGSLPYIFLAAAWIAWERFYFDTDISWPWLVLGNAFARTTWAIQWYEFTGTLGGSLWIWACNIGVFGIMTALSDGKWERFNLKAKTAAVCSIVAAFVLPPAISPFIGHKYADAMESDRSLNVMMIQPNIDPYHKFQALSQDQQNVIFLDMAAKGLKGRLHDSLVPPMLVLAPETFTSDVIANDITLGRTWGRMYRFLMDYPNTNILFGASSYEYISSASAPSKTARKIRDGLWVESHNSAIMTDGDGRAEIFHKNKLVVAVEMTPYPSFFVPIDDMLGGVMGRCVGQGDVSLLHVKAGEESIPVGCAICYESVYGEYYTEYIRKGAQAMTIITNDAWWGDTPGYRQHLSYACLRAIETRRAIARCANTGISAIISPEGKIISDTKWWQQDVLKGKIPLRDDMTFFVLHGDIVGRICTFLFCLLLLALLVRRFSDK